MVAPRIGYIIPEFPGQTHIWMWREICHMREWGCEVRLFSTRRPPARDRARHAFAAMASRETHYLADRNPIGLLFAIVYCALTRPIGLLRCLILALTLPVDRRPLQNLRLLLLVPAACRLAMLTRREAVTHLHCHTCANGAVIAMLNRRLTGIPYSMTLNANIEWWGGAMLEKMQDAEFTIAITEWLLAQIRRDYATLPPAKALLGRIGVDTQRWRPGDAAGLPAGGTARIVSVARLHPGKGFDVLIRSVKMLVDEGRSVRLDVAGDGPQHAELEALVADLGLQAVVRFLGSLPEDEVIALLRTADVFVLASHAEPLGVVYMEAMAIEVPSIGTRAGGVGEIIEDGVNGLLVPPGDPAALAHAIAGLLDDASRRRRLGIAGRRSIVEKFDSRIGAATLYRQIHGFPPQSAATAHTGAATPVKA